MAVLSGEALVLLAVLTLTPGADTFLTLRQGLVGGLRLAWPTIAGISTGTVVHAAVSGAGLATLFTQPRPAFEVVRFLGVGYRDGLATNLLNPKVALFYLAFLSPYNPAGQSTLLTSMLYGLCHALMGET